MSDDMLIFSFEHDAWWRPDGRGYTADVAEAGRYSPREAADICNRLDPRREETAIPAYIAYAIVALERVKAKQRAYDLLTAVKMRVHEVSDRRTSSNENGPALGHDSPDRT